MVLDDQGHAAGAVTRDDLVRIYAQGEYEGLTAEQIMQDGVHQIPPDIPLYSRGPDYAGPGHPDRFSNAPCRGHRISGGNVVLYRHLLRHLAMEDTLDLHDLGIKASREAPLESYFQSAVKRRGARQRPMVQGTTG